MEADLPQRIIVLISRAK